MKRFIWVYGSGSGSVRHPGTDSGDKIAVTAEENFLSRAYRAAKLIVKLTEISI